MPILTPSLDMTWRLHSFALFTSTSHPFTNSSEALDARVALEALALALFFADSLAAWPGLCGDRKSVAMWEFLVGGREGEMNQGPEMTISCTIAY